MEGAGVDSMSFRPADDGLTNALFSPSNLFLDGRDVDLVLREFAVDVLKLGAVAFVLRPPEGQGNLSAFADLSLHLRSTGRHGFLDPIRQRMNFVRLSRRAACAHHDSPHAVWSFTSSACSWR
jgi:hypothetical protein